MVREKGGEGYSSKMICNSQGQATWATHPPYRCLSHTEYFNCLVVTVRVELYILLNYRVSNYQKGRPQEIESNLKRMSKYKMPAKILSATLNIIYVPKQTVWMTLKNWRSRITQDGFKGLFLKKTYKWHFRIWRGRLFRSTKKFWTRKRQSCNTSL